MDSIRFLHFRARHVFYGWATCLILFSSLSYGQGRVVDFERLSIEDGLSESAVTRIVQDRHGFMWFATQDGLNRYDGHKFLVFRNDPADTNSLSDNYVSAICVDSKGRLWIGTQDGGLDLLKSDNMSFERFGPRLARSPGGSKAYVTSIVEDRSGILWIGTLGDGIIRMDPSSGGLRRLTHAPSNPGTLSHNSVWSLLIDKAGTLWAGTYDGLNRYDELRDSFEIFKISPAGSKSQSIINVLGEDSEGTVWCAAWKTGLFSFDQRKHALVPIHPTGKSTPELDKTAMSLAFDREGSIWIGLANAGLQRYDGRRLDTYRNDPADSRSISANQVLALFIDKTGVLWIGTNGGGINRFNGANRKFEHYRHVADDPNSLLGNNVWALHEDRQGNLWVGTLGGGLDKIDALTRRLTHYSGKQPKAAGLASTSISAILEDRKGTLWVGSQDAGVFRLDRSKEVFTRYSHNPSDPTSLGTNLVNCIHEDKQGTIWIGTFGGGLNRFEPGTRRFTRFVNDPHNPGGISGNSVMAMIDARDGGMWIGTYTQGVDKFKNGVFVHHHNDPADSNSLNNDRVESLYEDSSGTLWVGTWGGGLNRLDTSTGIFTHYTQKDGLPNATIYGILPDNRGNLWMSTNRGMARFNTTDGLFRCFDVTDGLQQNEFNQGAHLRMRSGELLFGGVNGFSRFSPDSVKPNTSLPPVVLTSLTVFGSSSPFQKDLVALEGLDLNYDQNFFSIDFTALDYTNPSRNRFAYMITGYDKTWVQAGNKRTATYTNVDPGAYTFRVIACNSDGNWNMEGVKLNLVIHPPLWKTWWAYSLYCFAGFALIVGLVRHRSKAHARILKDQRTKLEEGERQLAHERMISDHLRKAEEKLALSEHLLKESQIIAGLGSYEIELATGSWRSSEVLNKLLGIDDSFDRSSSGWARILHPEDRALMVDYFGGRIPGLGSSFDREYRIVRQNDLATRWVIGIGRLEFDAGGRPVMIRGTIQDITERRQAEEALRLAQKSESIGTLAGGIAHDFNNLLNAMLGQSTLAAGKLPKESPAKHHIEKSIKAAERAADLTRQLLAYSGKGRFTTEEIDLNRLVKENVQMLEVSVPKTTQIKYELDDSAPHILADVGQIQQVVMNLIINAGEAMGPNPGTITVRTGRIEIKQSQKEYSKYTNSRLDPGKYALLQVNDNGHGMKPEVLARIFDPFFTTKFTGRGLGLAAVLGIIRGHKGGVSIISENGKGTQFSVVFPLVGTPSKPRIQSDEQVPVSGGKGKTVLVIDDEPSVLELVTDILTDAEIKVIGSLSPVEGIELYARNQQSISLVVLDYSMPDMDGKTAFQELIKLNNEVRVLLCSGYTEEEIESAFGETRPAGFVHKPHKPDELLGKVLRLLAE